VEEGRKVTRAQTPTESVEDSAQRGAEVPDRASSPALPHSSVGASGRPFSARRQDYAHSQPERATSSFETASRLAALDHPSGVRAIGGSRQDPPRIQPERIQRRTPFSRARALPRSRTRRSHVSNSPASSRGTFKARREHTDPSDRFSHDRWGTSGCEFEARSSDTNVNRIEDRSLATRIPNRA
jgi:hypothetical protein